MVLGLAVVLGYLFGSVPVAYLVARAWGVNILQAGTRNPGTANVYRQVGPLPAAIVFAGDIAKAAVPMGLAQGWLGLSQWEALAVGAAAVAGHWFPLFLAFRGGIGLAPTIGVGFGLHPLAAGVGLAVSLLTVWRIAHNSSVGMGVGVAVFLVLAPLTGLSFPLALAALGIAAMAVPRRYLVPWALQRLRLLWPPVRPH